MSIIIGVFFAKLVSVIFQVQIQSFLKSFDTLILVMAP